MVVTIHHGPNDNNAQQIEYQDNLQGPIAAKNSGADNTVTILGQTVVVDDAAVFASLNLNEFVEVSGFVDSAGRIRATYIEQNPESLPSRRRARGQRIRFRPVFLRIPARPVARRNRHERDGFVYPDGGYRTR